MPATPPQDDFICNNCGGEVRADARVCPHCGADEDTWGSDRHAHLAGDDDFDLEEFKQREGLAPKPLLQSKLWVALVALALLGLIAIQFFRNFR